MTTLGYWAISGKALLDMLKRVANGEDPDMVYAEEYVNSEHEHLDGDDEHLGGDFTVRDISEEDDDG